MHTEFGWGKSFGRMPPQDQAGNGTITTMNCKEVEGAGGCN
jgi:hypothetical protein